MDMNDEIMSMAKGWIVHYEDGTIITEYKDGQHMEWNKIPKKGIKSLSLKWHEKNWTLYGKENYIQKKRGWVPWQSGELEPTTQYRYIGYWEGNNKVLYRVDDKTGEMKMEVESIGSPSSEND